MHSIRRASAASIATLTVLALTSSPSQAAARIVYDCDTLPGSGTYSDPLRLGNVTGRTVVASGCDPLTSGGGYSRRYFSFRITRATARGTRVGSRFILNSTQRSAVNPALLSGPLTVVPSGRGVWLVDDGEYVGRFLRLGPMFNGYYLRAGTYTVRMGKLDSPLRSTSTPSFNVYFVY